MEVAMPIRTKPMHWGSPLERAVQYTNRADELRAIAAAMESLEARELVLRAAQSYDGMADGMKSLQR